MEHINPKARFSQRFEHFEKAFFNLYELKNRDFSDFSTLEKEGIIQRFEIVIELSWKVIKDFLQSDGFIIASPKEAIRVAFSSNILDNSSANKWLESLNVRNITSHTYTQDNLNQNVCFILDEFLPLVEKLHKTLRDKLCNMD